MLEKNKKDRIKVSFITIGCKVNKYEVDVLKEKVEQESFEVVEYPMKKADVYCINSCTVTNLSQRKTRQMISHVKKINPLAIVAVIGCGVHGESDLQDLNADIILGNNEKMMFIQVLKEYISVNQKKVLCSEIAIKKDGNLKYNNNIYLKKAHDVRQAIKIEDGCDNFCTYCIIPYTRGRVISRPYEEIEKEVIDVCKNGASEIVLVGIEVASYGKDLKNISLIECIERLNELEEVRQIRLSSLEPRFLTKENIMRLKACEKLCPHFHISMQSGSNNVLKLMNRRYTVEDLIEICNNLHLVYDRVYIAADVIVGFPNESHENFNETIETIKKCEMCELHVFKYSKRDNTKAALMDGQIPGAIKCERSDKLIALSNELKSKYISYYIGKTVLALFESYKGDTLNGITKDYVKIIVKSKENLSGKFFNVKITGLKEDILFGSIVQ